MLHRTDARVCYSGGQKETELSPGLMRVGWVIHHLMTCPSGS